MPAPPRQPGPSSGARLPELLAASLPPSLRGFNFLRQQLQLLFVEHLGIDDADEDLLDRAIAEPLCNASHGLGRHTLAVIERPKYVGAPLDAVADVALLLQAPQ